MTGFVNVSRPIDPSKWIRADEIESILSDARGGSVITTRSGRDYRTDLTPGQVLDAITAEEMP